MRTLRTAAVGLALILVFGLSASAESPDAEPSASDWLDDQACVDPDFRMPMSASGTTQGPLFNCAKALGLREGDPARDVYDFTVIARSYSKENWTEQCDAAGEHVGSRYHASGTDRLFNDEKPDRVVTGTFELDVVSTLIDANADTWQVERTGVLWDLQASEDDFSWTWTVDITMPSVGKLEPHSDPSLDKWRGLKRTELQTLCGYLQ